MLYYSSSLSDFSPSCSVGVEPSFWVVFWSIFGSSFSSDFFTASITNGSATNEKPPEAWPSYSILSSWSIDSLIKEVVIGLKCVVYISKAYSPRWTHYLQNEWLELCPASSAAVMLRTTAFRQSKTPQMAGLVNIQPGDRWRHSANLTLIVDIRWGWCHRAGLFRYWLTELNASWKEGLLKEEMVAKA